MNEEKTDPRKTALRRSAFAVGILIAAFVIGQWWFGVPKRSTERFISLMRLETLPEARVLVRAGTIGEVDEKGLVEITGKDGSRTLVRSASFPFVSFSVEGDDEKYGFAEYFSRTYRFGLVSSESTGTLQNPLPTEMDCEAMGGKIVIHTVR